MEPLALTCFREAVLGPRWFRDRTSPDALARDQGIGRATAYRYLDEVTMVLAAQASGLHEALALARDEGFSHVILDGMTIPADRRREETISVRSSTCGTPARPTSTSGTSRPRAPQTGSRCGSLTPRPAWCTTSPPPASTPCPRCTALRRTDCPIDIRSTP